jgi:hypothetical protein
MHCATLAECLATGTDVQTLQVTTAFLTPGTQKTVKVTLFYFLFPMQLTLWLKVTDPDNNTYNNNGKKLKQSLGLPTLILTAQ